MPGIWNVSGQTAMRAEKGGKRITKAELAELYKVMFPEYPDIVTVPQIQKMLGVSRHMVYDLIGDGWIPALKIGNAYRIPKINVINYALAPKDVKKQG